jgi:hypothetical protein
VTTTGVPGSAPPVATTLPAPMFGRASSAVVTAAAAALKAMFAVVAPL